MPAPIPITHPATISSRISFAKIHTMPLTKNIAKPTASNFSDSPRVESQPDSNTNGIISREGNEVSICTSSCEAEGKIRLKSSKIGDTANPGNDVTADTDHMASNAKREIYPLPVDIFIAIFFYICIATGARRVPKKKRVKISLHSLTLKLETYSLTQRIWKPFARL